MIDPTLIIMVLVGVGAGISAGLYIVTKWLVWAVAGDVRDT